MASEPGRFKFPLDGRVCVALLLTLVIEIMSCFELAALRTLGEPRGRLSRDGALILPVDVGDDVIETHEHSSPVTNKLVPEGREPRTSRPTPP